MEPFTAIMAGVTIVTVIAILYLLLTVGKLREDVDTTRYITGAVEKALRKTESFIHSKGGVTDTLGDIAKRLDNIPTNGPSFDSLKALEQRIQAGCTTEITKATALAGCVQAMGVSDVLAESFLRLAKDLRKDIAEMSPIRSDLICTFNSMSRALQTASEEIKIIIAEVADDSSADDSSADDAIRKRLMESTPSPRALRDILGV